jgi:opacity protein-like surface antigen
MKKILIAMALAAGFTSAQAADATVYTGRNYTTGQNTLGFNATVFENSKLNVALGADRTVSGVDTYRFNAVAGYTFTKFLGMDVVPKLGLSYVTRNSAVNGYAATAGVGLERVLDKNITLVADYQYQKGQDAVSALDGNIVTVGLNFKF